LKQFILKSGPDSENLIKLEGSDYHYLVNVRRLAVGEFFPALLHGGEEVVIQVVSIDHGVLTGKCTLSAPQTGSSSEVLPQIILFQALPKGDKMDLIVRQAAEGGIAAIVPFVSEFSVGRTGGQKFSRWERIIKEARQQCGSKTATSLNPPVSMNELFEYWKSLNGEPLGLLFHHLPRQGLEHESLHGYLISNPKVIVPVIGPEGGFSEREVILFLENGFRSFTIGDTVLRTETAALYCAAAIRILLLERDSWELKQTKKGNVRSA
jgi:16S rRNA (uracil1498-N3)-methyltransferase